MARPSRSPVLVGRADECRRLDAVWAEARTGSPAFAVVTGVAGVGKSRVITEWAASAPDAGGVVVVGCQPAFDGPAPLTPVLHLLEALRADGLLPRAVGDDPAPAALAAARALDDFVTSLVRPVVLVVEDVQWADSTTLACLAHLDRVLRRRTSPVLVVLSVRSDDPSTSEFAAAYLEEQLLSPLTELVELAPIGDDAARELVRVLLGPSTPRDVVLDLATRGDGVPLWIEQLARAWPAARVPASARMAFGHRLRRLPARQRRVLAALAVAGSADDAFLLAASQPMSRPAFVDACRQLVDDGLVTAGSGDSAAISHALLREVVHDGLVPLERRRLHLMAAERLTATEPVASAAVARHYEAAGRSRDTLSWAFTAALEAERRGAVPESLRLLSLTIATWPAVDDAARVVGEQLWQVEERLAAQCAAVGDYDRSTGILLDLLEQEWAPRVLRARDVARLEAAIAFQTVNWSPEHAWPHVDHAWSLVADSPEDADLVPALSRLIRAEVFGGRRAHHGTLAAGLVEVARRAGDAHAEAEALVAHATVLQAASDFASAVTLFGAASDVLTRSGGSRQLLNDALVCLTECLHRNGRLEESAAAALRGVRQLSQDGDAASLVNPYLLHNAAYSAFKLGRWDEADRWWREVTTYGRGHADAVHLLPAPLLLARGDTAQVAPIVERHGASADASPELARYFLEVRAEFLLAEGRAADAVAAVELGLQRCEGNEQETCSGRLLLLGLRGAVALSSTDPRRGAQIAARLAGWSARARTSPLGPGTPTSIVTTPAVRAQWRAESGRLRGGDDVHRWTEAATAWQRIGRPHPEAYCRLRAAGAAAAAADPGTLVASLLDTFASVAVPLPAVPLLREAVETARRARVSPPASVRALLGDEGHTRPFGLSRRELEVMELVAQGLTNRQIAARLFISRSTVGVHLAHAFTKMDVVSRAQATARLLLTTRG